ncbi:MAG: class I SAM-dependent methyltransferase, partial [Parvularculaceae bacterium]|nr:class I SAM-dependent methyltransferase [Parvularculaceae bacterium]
MDLKEERAIGGDPSLHWYYIAKGRAIKSLLGTSPVETVLDVGAGSGVFARQMIESGAARRAVCVDPGYSDEDLRRSDDPRLSRRRGADRTGADLVLMVDVI